MVNRQLKAPSVESEARLVFAVSRPATEHRASSAKVDSQTAPVEPPALDLSSTSMNLVFFFGDLQRFRQRSLTIFQFLRFPGFSWLLR